MVVVEVIVVGGPEVKVNIGVVVTDGVEVVEVVEVPVPGVCTTSGV